MPPLFLRLPRPLRATLRALLCCAALGLCVRAPAATLTVSNTNNSGAGSLRQAISDAAAGDTITFGGFAIGTIYLSNGPLEIDRALTIQGPGRNALKISGGDQVGVFSIRSGAAVVAISGLTITRGHAQNYGGGIYVYTGGLNLSDCAVTQNTAAAAYGLRGFGGGLSFGNASLPSTIQNCLISGNVATPGDGGGVYLSGGTGDSLTMTGCTVSGNTAQASVNLGGGTGGGVDVLSGTLTVSGCTFTGNTADSGAGINSAGNLTLLNSTLAANSAVSLGGGIAGGGPLQLTDCTLAGNSVTDPQGSGGGLSWFVSGSVPATLQACLIAGNHAGSGPDVSVLGPSPSSAVTSGGSNLIGNGNGAVGFTGAHDQVGTQAAPIDPKLGPLQDNGGPVQTMALLPGSPALDADYSAAPPAADARGAARPLGVRADIGAYERVATQALVVTNTLDNGPGSLRAAIATANVDEGDTITFAPNVVGTIGLTSGELAISRDLTIQGPGASVLAVSGGGLSRVFHTGTPVASSSAPFPSAHVTIHGLTIRDGSAPDDGAPYGGIHGGGLFAESGALTLNACVVSNNQATGAAGRNGFGGGLYNQPGCTLTMTGCTFTGNRAASGYGEGGGANVGGPATVTDCTFTGNTGHNGAGLAFDGGAVELTSCTVTRNTLIDLGPNNSGIGGGLFLMQATATVTGCIIAGNLLGSDGGPPSGNGRDVFGFYNVSVTSGGSNLIGVSDYTGFTYGAYGFTNGVSHDQVGTQVASINPRLGPLQDNGGPTPTVAVLPGSPAIGGDYADATATDQRGIARTSAQHTIGAYEYQSPHTHLLWNNSDGRVMLWSVAADGSFTLNGFGPYTDGAPQNKWSATAVATGADGKSHLLWNNTDGRVMLWTVDDGGNFTLAGYGPYTDNAPGNVWHATAVSVGPDNTVHLLWNNTDHRVMLWNVAQDFSFSLAGYGPYTDTSVSSDPGNLWSATALATGPDNVSRIAWNNANGRVMLWNVTSGFTFTLTGYGPYTDGAPQNQWSAVGVSVGPDNLTHLLWSNTDRRAMFWNVDQSFNFTLAGYGPYTDNAPQNLWSAAALATGPDNMSHILWGNTDYRAMLWGVDNAFDFTVAGYGPYTDNAPNNLWIATAVSAGP